MTRAIEIPNLLRAVRKMRMPAIVVHRDQDVADWQPLLDLLDQHAGGRLRVVRNESARLGTVTLTELMAKDAIIDPI